MSYSCDSTKVSTVIKDAMTIGPEGQVFQIKGALNTGSNYMYDYAR